MRLPRHDTPLSLPAEPPAEALAADEALLSVVAESGEPQERWWIASTPAVVLGLGLHQRLSSIVDVDRCQSAGVEILTRRAGGGALLLDPASMICGAICLPSSDLPSDVTQSYRWLGEALAKQLAQRGIRARRIELDEARADVAALRSRDDPVANALLTTCYGALSPHEVAVGSAKLVGLAQVRRREGALFQIGVLLEDQSRLAEYLRLPNETVRGQIRAALARRTVGLRQEPRSGMLESTGDCQHAQSVP